MELETCSLKFLLLKDKCDGYEQRQINEFGPRTYVHRVDYESIWSTFISQIKKAREVKVRVYEMKNRDYI